MKDLYSNPPGEHLQGCHYLPDRVRYGRGGYEAVHYAHDHLRQQVADMLVRHPEFFTYDRDDKGGGLAIRFDCRVMTTKDLQAALRAAYCAGQEDGMFRTG